MKLKKRAVAMPFLVILVLALVILLSMGPLSSTIVSTLKRGSDVEKCRISAIAQSKTKVAGTSIISLKCPRRQLTFYDNRVVVNGKMMRKYDFDKLDDETVNKIIAEELRLCWYKMGEGEYDVFKQNIIAHDKVCVVCTEIDFDEDVKQEKFLGLVDYLEKETMPNSKLTYQKYLVKSQENMYVQLPGGIQVFWTQVITSWLGIYGTTNLIQKGFDPKEESKKTPFEKSKKYIVYFLGFKPGKYNEIVSAYDSAYYIGLGEPDKLERECARLQN